MSTVSAEKLELQEPINFTDPYVLHDPSFTKGVIAHLANVTTVVKEEIEKKGNYKETDDIKSRGILYPLLKINGSIIPYTQIEDMVIYYDNFLCTLKLEIKDDGNLIQHTDVPTLNNIITIIIVPEINNIYKTITLDFKINYMETTNNHIVYYAKQKILNFNKKNISEIVYPGCPTVKNKIGSNNQILHDSVVSCNPSPNLKPNTWEMLHVIANLCQLGFASTDDCKNINDRLPRLIYNKSYDEFIEEQILFSGLDENSIFDVWVDLYGYIVMINVSWLLNNDSVVEDNLAINSFTGVHMTDGENQPEQTPLFVHRTLTNFEAMESPNNLYFKNYRVKTDNSDLTFGTTVSMQNFELSDINGGANAINQYDVSVQLNSIDDSNQYRHEYDTEYQEELVIECNDLPINKQRLIRKKFFSKHRQRILEIELDKINLGLQRGTLVNVVIFSDSKAEKQKIVNQTTNIGETNKDEPEQDKMMIGDKDYKKLIDDENIRLPNMAFTGMYYIDSMRFEYSYNNNEIKQFINLIKKSNVMSNLNNIHNVSKIDIEEVQ